MPTLTDPEAMRPLSRAGRVSELERVLARRASRPFRSACTAPVPGETDAPSPAMSATKDGGRPAATCSIAMPEISSRNLSAPIAPAKSLDAATGQSEMAMEGAELAACRAEATSKPAAAPATWREVP